MTFFSSTLSKVVGAVVIALLVAAVTAYITHRADQAHYDDLVIAQQKAMQAATTAAANKQNAVDRQNVVAAVTEEKAQEKIRYVTRTITETIHDNVTPVQDAAASRGMGCVTFGFVRVLVAAERGVPADSLDYPAGESADSCAAVALSDVAAQLSEAFGVARANAEQLNALIASLQANQAASQGQSAALPADASGKSASAAPTTAATVPGYPALSAPSD